MFLTWRERNRKRITLLTVCCDSGLTSCMNDQDCLGVNRECSHAKKGLLGECVCKEGFLQEGRDSVACAVRQQAHLHNSCRSDEDCKSNEVCMSWKYDPALEFARSVSLLPFISIYNKRNVGHITGHMAPHWLTF